MDSEKQAYDVVIVGGGHNGLTAAAYLARAGLSVLVLERLDHVGGATVSAQAFTGHAARISRYAALVSAMPQQLIDDLELDLELEDRLATSYTPTVRDGRHDGLLVNRDPEFMATSFRALTGSTDAYVAWAEFHDDLTELTSAVAPTLLEPLPVERAIRSEVSARTWQDFVVAPLGEAMERRFDDDTVRGAVVFDALLGTFASLRDPSLVQNRCFLYHRLGYDRHGSGRWRVPVGGMGSLASALEKAAREAGAEIVTGAGVSQIRAEADGAEVSWHDGIGQRTVLARHVLANVAPWVLRILMGDSEDADTKPQGSQVTVNMLLDRLPRMRSGMRPGLSFSGTLLTSTGYGQLEAAYAEAAAGRMPSAVPGGFSCHSMTDPTVLADSPDGMHTLSFFGVHTPASLFESDREAARQQVVSRALSALDEHLEEPLEACLAHDADGNPCIEVKVPQDVEADLAMPGGHIYHGDLDWPWASNRARLDTPAQQWGVQTGIDSVMVCGAGARRGGAVSGIGGHNAAQAVLASR